MDRWPLTSCRLPVIMFATVTEDITMITGVDTALTTTIGNSVVGLQVCSSAQGVVFEPTAVNAY